MNRKRFGMVSVASLLLVVIIVLIWSFTPTAAATIDDIKLDRDAIDIRMKEKIIEGNAVKLDDIVLELAKEQMILHLIKGTAQDITREEYETMRKSAQESYDKNAEENDAFAKKYNMSKEELIEWDLSFKFRVQARGRCLVLIYDELLSEYEQQYGTDQAVDPEKMVQVFDRRMEQMVSDLPTITYNSSEMDKLTASFEEWTQSLDDSVPLPDIQLSY